MKNYKINTRQILLFGLFSGLAFLSLDIRAEISQINHQYLQDNSQSESIAIENSDIQVESNIEINLENAHKNYGIENFSGGFISSIPDELDILNFPYTYDNVDLLDPYLILFRSGNFVVPDPATSSEAPILEDGSDPFVFIQFYDNLPKSDEIKNMGIKPIHLVNGSTIVAKVPGGFNPQENKNIRWMGTHTIENKISPYLEGWIDTNHNQKSNSYVIVEGYDKVTKDDLKKIIEVSNLKWIDNKYFPENIILVEVNSEKNLDNLTPIFEDNKVSYVYPGTENMLNDNLIFFRKKEMTEYGTRPFFLKNRISQGWDENQGWAVGLRGSANINFVFNYNHLLPYSLLALQLSSQSKEALDKWVEQVHINVTPITLTNQPDTIEFILDNTLSAGGSTYSIPQYPDDFQIEPFAGDINLTWQHLTPSDDFSYSQGDVETFFGACFTNKIDYETLALKNSGFALGVDETDNPDDVSYRGISAGECKTKLRRNDIANIQTIYCPKASSLEDCREGGGLQPGEEPDERNSESTQNLSRTIAGEKCGTSDRPAVIFDAARQELVVRCDINIEAGEWLYPFYLSLIDDVIGIFPIRVIDNSTITIEPKGLLSTNRYIYVENGSKVEIHGDGVFTANQLRRDRLTIYHDF